MLEVHKDDNFLGEADFLRRRILKLQDEQERQNKGQSWTQSNTEKRNLENALTVERKRSQELRMVLQEVVGEQDQEVVTLFTNLGESLQKLLKDSHRKISNERGARKRKLQIRMKRLKEMLEQDDFNEGASKFDAAEGRVKTVK
jgi:hypothetical protein